MSKKSNATAQVLSWTTKRRCGIKEQREVKAKWKENIVTRKGEGETLYVDELMRGGDVDGEESLAAARLSELMTLKSAESEDG